MGFETALMNLVTQPKLIEALVEKIKDWNCGMWKNIFMAAPGQIDIAYVGDDPAGQFDMMISPRIWRKFFKSAFGKLFHVAKSQNIKVMFHICGNARPIIPDLIDIGMDILMPVQVSAKDMDPVELKREFGAYISFWGGIDTQKVLPFGSTSEVESEVKRVIDELAPGGGFIINPVHNIQPNVPLKNLISMLEAIEKYR